MSKSRQKCKAAECEECPEWIFTFADLVMLMMGFFVILWVLKPAGKQGATDNDSVADQKKWEETVGDIRKGFGWVPDPQSADPVDKAAIQKATGQKNGAETQTPRETAPGTDHEVTTVRPGPVSAVGSRLLFDSGSSKLTPETMHSLDAIAEKIRGHYNIIMVKGHTALDDLPDRATGEQKMDLSLRRAAAAADYLVGKGISPEVLRVQGCSTFEPVRQRAYTAEGQADNRRVEIESMAELTDERKDQNNAQPSAVNLDTPTPAEKPPAEKQ